MQLPPETNKHDVNGFGTDARVWMDRVWKETPGFLQGRGLVGVEEGSSSERVQTDEPSEEYSKSERESRG